ncbi:MAG: tyrosine-type recombinase/integrase [Planctomycetes bacterium]|nr:tyrosine-type recombinase/integrase [Planctomycetota bacterium]
MAWLEQRGGQFHLGIRLGNRKLKRALKTSDAKEAQDIADRVERRWKLIEQGDLALPADADPLTFLLSDGKLVRPVEVSVGLPLSEMCRRYLDALPQGSLESNTVYTLKIHLKHLQRVLGERFRADRLAFADLQRYVDTRSLETGQRGKTVSPVTIKKELTSFSGAWTWASRMSLVKTPFPNKGLRFSKTEDKAQFQTWAEIERCIEIGGLSETDQAELWDGLYLTAIEIEQVLDFVETKALHPAIYPMLVMAAHTGARRSEILRAETADFDLVGHTVRLRELKRSRGKRTTRTVPLSGRLLRVVTSCLSNAKGRFAFSFDGCPLSVDEASHHFKQTLSGSKWDKIRGWHVFRHSFISNCASQGIDQRMIDAWTGHQTEEMRKRYRHLFPTVQRAALQSVFGS